MGVFGLTDMETFWDKQYDTKALLGWNRDTVVLSFRGTNSFTNAWADLKVEHRYICLPWRACIPAGHL